MLNTIPQDPSSVMRFVDGADERQLMSMVSSKNPYSFMALAKLQSIRDAKMKEQAGQPMPPPMSEQIPQQLAQLASGQRPQQQPMQQPMQPPMQQPMQQPMQPQQPQGIASIGGEPNGAGGGMVSFTDGGGVRRFAAPGGDQLVTAEPEESTSRAGNWLRSLLPKPLTEEDRKKAGEMIQNRRDRIQLGEEMRANEISPFTATTATERKLAANKDAELADRMKTLQSSQGATAPTAAPVPLTPEQQRTVEAQVGQQFQAQNAGASGSRVPAVPVGDQSGSNSGLGSLSKGALDLFNQSKSSLSPGFLAQQEATQNTANVMRQEQAKLDAAYDPAKFTAAQGTQEERDKLQADRLAKLEQSMPDPYKKTAERLSSLGEELGKDKANAPYQAMLSAAFKLMGNRSPYFMTALGESGAAGLTDYNQIKDANKKQEMSLMSAESSLFAAQDARKRGMNNDANAYMKEFYDRKKDAYNFGLESAKAKAVAAIQIAGHGEKLPQQQIDQAKTFVVLHESFFKHNVEIQKLRQEGAKTAASMIPDAAKLALYLSKNPGLVPFIERSENVALTAKLLLAEEKNPENMGKSEQYLIDRVSKMVAAAKQVNPMPLNTPVLR